MTFPFHLQYPSRESQLVICRWAFLLSYIAISAVFSAILIQTSAERMKWIANVGIDILLATIFVVYYKNCHAKAVRMLSQEGRASIVLTVLLM